LKKTLADGVQDVIVSKRLVDAPAIDRQPRQPYRPRRCSGSWRHRGSRRVSGSRPRKEPGDQSQESPHQTAGDLQETDEEFAVDVARQIYDNAMIQAGLVVDPLIMVERNYKILNRAVQG